MKQIPIMDDLNRFRPLKNAFQAVWDSGNKEYYYVPLKKGFRKEDQIIIRFKFQSDYETVCKMPTTVDICTFENCNVWTLRMCSVSLFKDWKDQKNALAFDSFDQALHAAYEIAQEPDMLATMVTDCCKPTLKKKPKGFSRVDLTEHFSCNQYDYKNRLLICRQNNDNASSSYEPGSSSVESIAPGQISMPSISDSDDDEVVASSSSRPVVYGRKRHRAPSPSPVEARAAKRRERLDSQPVDIPPQLLDDSHMKQIVSTCMKMTDPKVEIHRENGLSVVIHSVDNQYPTIFKFYEQV